MAKGIYERSPEQLERLRSYRGMLGKTQSDKFKTDLSKRMMGKKYFLGHRHTEEAKRQDGESKLGIPRTEAVKQKIRVKLSGRKLSEELRQKAIKALFPYFSNQSGKNNHQWIDGNSRNGYPKEFNEALKFKIRTRDNFTCQVCARTEMEELAELGFVLCVNHIDFDKNNCTERNLNTLCRRCNIKINRNREYWTTYFIEQQKILV